MIESRDMFNGKKCKSEALLKLKNRWKMPCLVSLVGFVIIACMNMVSEISVPMKILSACIYGMIFVAQLSVFFKIVNLKSDDEKNPENEILFKDFLSGFDDWLTSFLGTLWICLWTWLWTLLFLVPGIVKAISYSMMFWVISENPGISVRKAMRISKILTNGHKADIFVLYLSFFGWFLLSCVTCGIGLIWLHPYVTTTMTNAYYDLKLEAFNAKKLKSADFE